MEQRTKEAARHVDAVLRALDILDCFQEDCEMSLKDIIGRTGITRSRAMRLIGSLESRGYLTENPDTHYYHPGIKLALLGRSFENFNSIEVIARPVIRALALETGESATLYVDDGSERVALIREEGTHAIRFSVREGQRLPINAGASAKVLMAFGPPERLIQVAGPAGPEADRFIREVERVRSCGYAISKGENIPDAHAIAAPVFSFDKTLVGALGIAGPASRLDDKKLEKRVNVIVEAANRLSTQLGQRNESDQ
jgi:DNA-binding IclR family transcriptional regulator